MPNWGNSAIGVSNEHSEPDGRFSPFSDVNHIASPTFTTNQPSVVGARPEPESSSCASRTARVYSALDAERADVDRADDRLLDAAAHSGGEELRQDRRRVHR